MRQNLAVKIYWDIAKEDGRIAQTIAPLVEKLNPRPERYVRGTKLSSSGAVLFGFVWIVSRADVADEDATEAWANAGTFSLN